MFAMHYNSTALVRFLAARANVHARCGIYKQMPVILALAAREGGITTLLLAAGADPNAVDDEGRPAVQVATHTVVLWCRLARQMPQHSFQRMNWTVLECPSQPRNASLLRNARNSSVIGTHSLCARQCRFALDYSRSSCQHSLHSPFLMNCCPLACACRCTSNGP